MWSGRQVTWLGLTPEPERELPAAVAVLRRGAATHPGHNRPAGGWVSAERRRIESLVVRGTQRAWLRYLTEVTTLVRDVDADAPAGTVSAELRAAETVLDHHRMLIGLPGPAYQRVAAQRAELAEAVAGLRSRR